MPGISPSAAARLLARARRQIDPHIRRAVEKGLKIYVQRAKDEAPVGKHYDADGTLSQPADLRNSITFRFGSTGRTLGEAITNQAQAIWVIRGIHWGGKVIRPRSAPYLVFWWPKINATVFATKVTHPGTIPNPFHVRAFRGVERQMRASIAEEVRNIKFEFFK